MKPPPRRTVIFWSTILTMALIGYVNWDFNRWSEKKTAEDEARFRAMVERIEREDREFVEQAIEAERRKKQGKSDAGVE